MKNVLCGALALAAALGGGLSWAEEPVPVLMFVGVASKPVLDEAAPRILNELGIRMELSAGGSGTVLTQMELGRTGDIYLPASSEFVDRAVARGLVDPATRVTFAVLTPALLVRSGNPKHILTLADLGRADVRAAIAEPRTVCVGEYAARLLQRAGLADSLMPRFARAHSVEALANLLVLGNVDAILGWEVLTRWFPEQVEVVPVSRSLITERATISGAVSTFAAHPRAARRVLGWLAGEEGRAIWRAHGYRTEPPPAP